MHTYIHTHTNILISVLLLSFEFYLVVGDGCEGKTAVKLFETTCFDSTAPLIVCVVVAKLFSLALLLRNDFLSGGKSLHDQLNAACKKG